MNSNFGKIDVGKTPEKVEVDFSQFLGILKTAQEEGFGEVDNVEDFEEITETVEDPNSVTNSIVKKTVEMMGQDYDSDPEYYNALEAWSTAFSPEDFAITRGDFEQVINNIQALPQHDAALVAVNTVNEAINGINILEQSTAEYREQREIAVQAVQSQTEAIQ